jgi:signal transduction histidine kinase
LTTQLEAAVRAREDFLAVASHDLRNPVNAIQLQVVSVLRQCDREDGSLDPEWLCHRLGRANSQVKRLTRLLDNLMDVSRLTGGSLPLERENVEFGSVELVDVEFSFRKPVRYDEFLKAVRRYVD